MFWRPEDGCQIPIWDSTSVSIFMRLWRTHCLIVAKTMEFQFTSKSEWVNHIWSWCSPLSPFFAAVHGESFFVFLRYLHSAGIYHRDLKPANCLVNQASCRSLTVPGRSGMIPECEPGLFHQDLRLRTARGLKRIQHGAAKIPRLWSTSVLDFPCWFSGGCTGVSLP